MSAICMRPAIEPRTLRDGRTYDQCAGCSQISPLNDDGIWAQVHRGEAVAANTEIDREAS